MQMKHGSPTIHFTSMRAFPSLALCCVTPKKTGVFFKLNLKNSFVSPYPTLFYRYGSVGRKINCFNFSNWIPIKLNIQYNPVFLKKKEKTNVCFFRTDYRIMQVKSIAECSRYTFDLPLAPKTFIVYIFEWPFEAGFTV